MSQASKKSTYSFPILIRREPSRARDFRPLRRSKHFRIDSAVSEQKAAPGLGSISRQQAQYASSSRTLFVPKLVKPRV